ncbi:hypothetical protein [Clostridium sp.]|uniref:hypothetical protein n=1 Tax=Clostridium sp. TaxID=1506 RepID=UPI002FCA6910
MKRFNIMIFFISFISLFMFASCSSENKPSKAIEVSVNNVPVKSYEFNGEPTVPLEMVCNILEYHNRKYVQEGNEKIFVASKNNYMYFYKGRDYFSSRPKKLNEIHKSEDDKLIEESYNKVSYEGGFKAISYGGTLYIPVNMVESDECLEIGVRYIDEGYRLGKYTQVK